MGRDDSDLTGCSVVIRIRVNGPPVTDTYTLGAQNVDLGELCKRILGHTPPSKNGEVRLGWLKKKFLRKEGQADFVPATEELAVMRARGYILHLLGAFLFSTSSNTVSLEYLIFLEHLSKTAQYSWASAVLSYLYNGMCKAVKDKGKTANGCAVLLQLWSWEHLHVGRPSICEGCEIQGPAPLGMRWTLPKTFKRNPKPNVRQYYRAELEALEEFQVMWNPYTPQRLENIPGVCTEDQDLCLAKVPLIHFSCVEWHLVDRVLRQFSMNQHIPLVFDDIKEWERLHSLRWTKRAGWVTIHDLYIKLWDDRRQYIVRESEPHIPLSDYLAWHYKVRVALFKDIKRLAEGTDLEPTLQFEPHGEKVMLLMRHFEEATRLARKVQKMGIEEIEDHVNGLLEVCRNAHDITGGLQSFNRILEEVDREEGNDTDMCDRSVVPGYSDDQNHLDDTIYLQSQLTQEPIKTSRPSKIRIVRCSDRGRRSRRATK